MHKRNKQHAGFTIIELLVTMTILGLMLFLLNELFQGTSQAVTRSVQTSKITATTRSVGEQINDDAESMVGPADSSGIGGYIVIIQRQLPNINMLDPFNLSEVTVDQLRCDQIVFIREADGLRSMTPQNENGFGSSLVAQPNDYAKVWYGITQRTQPDGTRVGTTAATLLGGANAGIDRIGSNFILGRQAMLFNPTDTFELSKPLAAQRADPTIAGDPNSYTHAENAYYSAAVNRTGFSSPARSFMGLTDVTRQAYGPQTTPGTLLAQLNAGTLPVMTNRYLNTTYQFNATRLRVNPSSDPSQTNYESWAIAQAHPILAQSCSEFIVDFAADLNGNGRIDTIFGGGNDLSGSIWWYDALTQSNLGDGSGGTIGWARPSPGIPQPYIDPGLLEGNARAFVFRTNDDASHPGPLGTVADSSTWPYLIRIRYRLHDTRGRLTSNNPLVLNDGLDNDGDGVTDENDEDKISGRWFEHIIRVPRP